MSAPKVQMCKLCQTRHGFGTPHSYVNVSRDVSRGPLPLAKLTFGVTSVAPILPDELIDQENDVSRETLEDVPRYDWDARERALGLRK